MTLDKYSVPLNAYPLAGTEGRAIPSNVRRPGWVLKTQAASPTELPDEVNFVTLIVDTPILIKELGNVIDAEGEYTIDPLTHEPQERTMFLTTGTHDLILSRYILTSGTAVVNGSVLWQQLSPTTKWRANYGHSRN